MKQQTKLSLVIDGLRVILLILMAAFSLHLLIQSDYYMGEYRRVLELAGEAQTWDEMAYYTSWAQEYHRWSDTYMVFSFTVLFTIIGLVVTIGDRKMSDKKTETTRSVLTDIRNMLAYICSQYGEDENENCVSQSTETDVTS